MPQFYFLLPPPLYTDNRVNTYQYSNNITQIASLQFLLFTKYTFQQLPSLIQVYNSNSTEECTVCRVQALSSHNTRFHVASQSRLNQLVEFQTFSHLLSFGCGLSIFPQILDAAPHHHLTMKATRISSLCLLRILNANTETWHLLY